MQSESIKARVSFGLEQQGDIGFIYDYELLKELKIAFHARFKDNRVIDIGSTFTLNGQNYKVTKIRTVLYDKTIDMSNPSGINIFGIGDRFDYNFEIMYFVKEIE